DDVIGTLARQATEVARPVVISTGDKDMAQLVNQYVTLVNTMTDSCLDEDGVKQKYGFGPERMIDFLALMGDKVDNIPGVPGVGEKTALGLIQGLGGLDDIYGDLEAVRILDFRGAKKMPEKLLEHREQAYLSYQLATIKTDVPLDLRPEDITMGEPDNSRLRDLFIEQEFKGWVSELENDVPQTKAAPAGDAINSGINSGEENDNQPVTDSPSPVLTTNYVAILDETDFQGWLAKLAAAPLFAFDTETTSIDAMQARIVGLSFAVTPGEAAYIPCGHDYMGA